MIINISYTYIIVDDNNAKSTIGQETVWKRNVW